MGLPTSVFENAMHEMVIRWQKCTVVNGDYFEGQGITVDPLFECTSDLSSSDTDAD